MTTLNLFPARVPTGQVTLPDGTVLDVMASMEFLKALKVLFERVGGPTATSNADLDDLLFQSLTSGPVAQPVVEFSAPEVDYSPVLSDLARQIDELRIQLTTNTLSAEIAALRAQLDELALRQAAPAPAPDYSDFLRAYAEPQAAVDWEHPGKIGARTASTGRFTTVDATNSAAGAASTAYTLFDATGNYGFGMGPTGTEGYINYSSGTASTAVFGHRWKVNGVEVAKVDGTGMFTVTTLKTNGILTTPGGATFHTTSTALTNGAGAGAGTLTNAPAAGDPTKWIGINDNGTTRYIPAW